MRLVARFPNNKQVSSLVDSLRNIGFDRKDMIISDLAEEQIWHSIEDAAKNVILVKSERDSISEIGTLGSGVKGLKGSEGIIVAVETPKHNADRVREFMEQAGAVEIIDD